MGEDACSVVVQFSATLLFCISERSPVALGINGKVISRAYALGPARGGRGLCATVCTPTWVFVCVWIRVCVCLLYVQGQSQQESLIDSQRILREANTWANKCTLVQSGLHVLTRLCQQPCSERRLPLGSSAVKRTIKLKTNKYIDVLQHFSAF